MNQILCTVMIPSRKRPEMLDRCIQSVIATAADPANYEILVRLDDDDTSNVEVVAKYAGHPNVAITTGPRLGYDQLDTGYYTQLAAAGRGKWCWIVNDDMVFIIKDGCQWDLKLAEVPDGRIVQPEIHGLGDTRYQNDTRTGSPCFLKNCWFEAGFSNIPPKADYVLTAKLESLGWHTSFLEGLTIWHDRDENAERWKATHYASVTQL